MTTLSVGSVDYERFGLTADEYDKCRFNLYLPSYHIYKDENEFSVLYFDSDDGIALFSSNNEMFEGTGFQMKLIDCNYCDIPFSYMIDIIEIFKEFEEEIDKQIDEEVDE